MSAVAGGRQGQEQDTGPLLAACLKTFFDNFHSGEMRGDGGMQRRGGAVSRSPELLDIAWKALAAESDCSGMATMASQPRPAATVTPPPYFYLKYIKIVSIDELLRPWHN